MENPYLALKITFHVFSGFRPRLVGSQMAKIGHRTFLQNLAGAEPVGQFFFKLVFSCLASKTTYSASHLRNFVAICRENLTIGEMDPLHKCKPE